VIPPSVGAISGTLTARSGVDTGFLSENAINAKMLGAFSGKVDTGFPSENAINAKMPGRFLFPVGVKPL
jgi:hypothetical protein